MTPEPDCRVNASRQYPLRQQSREEATPMFYLINKLIRKLRRKAR